MKYTFAAFDIYWKRLTGKKVKILYLLVVTILSLMCSCSL